jgi:hypothetical protein
VRQVRSAAEMAGSSKPRSCPFGHGGPFGNRRLRQPLPGPVWPLGHGEASSIHRRSSRSCLARMRPFGHGGPFGDRLVGQPLPGPVWPQGHDEPDPLHRNDVSVLVRCVREDAPNHSRNTAVRCGDRDRCTTKHVALDPPPSRPRRRLGDWGRCTVQTMRRAWPECGPLVTWFRLASTR